MATSSAPPDPSDCTEPVVLQGGDLIGLTLTSEVGLLSLAAILLYAWRLYRDRAKALRAGINVQLVKYHLDVYMVFLLVADLLQALGGIVNLHWLVEKKVHCGRFCDFQGTIQQLGEPCVAFATLAIAVHTFFEIFGWEPPDSLLIPYLYVGGCVALIVGLVAGGAGKHKNFYTPTPLWCWVSDQYGPERLGGEYVWLWSAAGVALILYVLVALRLRGHIRVDPLEWVWHPQAAHGASPTALRMLLYPAAYLMLVLPISIQRWWGGIALTQSALASLKNAPNPVAFFGVIVFGMTGLVDVLLLVYTRPGILTADGPTRGNGIAPE